MRPLPPVPFSAAGKEGILSTGRKDSEPHIFAKRCRRSYLKRVQQFRNSGCSIDVQARIAHCALILKAEAGSVGTKGYDLADLSHVGGPKDSWDHLKLAGMIRG